MKLTVYRRLLVLVALLSATFSNSQALQAEEKVVNLQEVMAAAKEQNGELKALREERGVGEAGRIRAALHANPVLDLEAETGAFAGSSSENLISIGVSQEFLTGGKRGKRLAVADSELLAYERRLEDTERLLLLEVKLGFYDLLLAQGRADLAQKFHELNRRLLLITRERLDAGDIAELDMNLAKVETARSAAAKIEAERDLLPAGLRLLSLMGAPASLTLKPADAPKPLPVSDDLAELKALALRKRPDLQAMQSEVAKGEAELVLAEAERLPNLTAGVALIRESTRTSVGGFDEKDTEYLVGLKLSIPIPLFDRNKAGLMEARSRKSGSQMRQFHARRQIEREVEVARAQWAASDAFLKLYAEEIIPQLTENLDLIRQAYVYGEIGMPAVIEEQKKFLEVNQCRLSALHQRQTALAKLEAAVGIELTESTEASHE